MIDTIAELSREQGFYKSRLPPFSPEEKELIKGTLDVMVLIYKSTYLVVDHFDVEFPPSAQKDVQIERSVKKEWVDPNSFYTSTPWGFRKTIKYVWDNYGQPVIAIASACYGAYDDSLDDKSRINQLRQFFEQVSLVINEDRVDLQYFSVWSLIDSFFFQYAYTAQFGLYHVNFNDPARPRTAKQSAKYYRKIIKTREL
ncbi:unnamed protein product [Ceutorhynchus assimilis]|uniref:Uncharacterized protein n=1 Tax=Ceutorhynchus assimilis TaxID=467358 RepID=A0A9N9MEP6_9CUCU|nr:unnamed protein product [Ceutorhynchus assimilis]